MVGESPWAHTILVTEIDPSTRKFMRIELDAAENDAYTNFTESIRGAETRRGYIRNLTRFLNMIPDDVFGQYLGEQPKKKSRDVKEMSQSFIDLARKDITVTKSILKSYVKEVKQEVDSNKISPNTVSNRLKPIKALLSANEVDVSWKLINKMLPRRTKSEDRAYTREEIHKMIECCTDVTDKVIVLMFSSAGFRLESWDYFCWKDVIFFQDKTQQYTGAALRVYRGDPEEYWTFITPEACRTLALYKEEWRSRFLKYPDKDDPLIASTRFDRPIRLQSKGVRARVDKIVTKIGLRDGIKKNQRRYEVKLDHGFRKYFNTMMRRAKVNYLDKEDMMGHKVGLEQAYERYQEEDFERFPEYWANKAINAKKSIEQGDTKKVRGYDSQSDLYAVHQTDLALLRGAIMSFPCWGAAVCPLVQTGWNAGESNVQLWWVPTDGNIGYESSVCLASDTHHNEVTFDMQTKRDLKNILQTWIYVYDNTVSVTLDGDEGECESNYYQRSVSAGSSAGLTTGISNISLN